MIHRIITERKNLAGIRAILAAHKLDYSMFHGQGCFNGTPEPCTVIELCFITPERAQAAAVAIGRANNQQCVMLQTDTRSTARLIDTGGTGYTAPHAQAAQAAQA